MVIKLGFKAYFTQSYKIRIIKILFTLICVIIIPNCYNILIQCIEIQNILKLNTEMHSTLK